MSLASARIDPRFDGVERRAVARAAANAEVMADAPEAAADGEPARGVVEAALRRILDSRTFRQSERHRAFLRYVVVATLDGRARMLKEVVLGLEVFGRDLAGYDPRRDSIVRVEARRLRRKLARYYAAEGQRDVVEIRLEAGSYAPRFVRCPLERASGTTQPALCLVLPCRAADGDVAIARDLADQLTDRLGALPGVCVLNPLVTARLSDVDAPLGVLRHEYGVRYVVDGSIARAGERLRYVVRLSGTDDGVQRWSGIFDFDPAQPAPGDAHDLFAFQDRIVDAVFDAMRVERDARTRPALAG